MVYAINIEWLEEGLPKHLDWKAICPQLVILYGWLQKHDCLDHTFVAVEPYLSGFIGVEDGSIAMHDFVESCLDGELTDECIVIKDRKEFFGDYLAIAYANDLEKYFQVSSAYELPAEWCECKKFYEVLDKRFHEFKSGQPWG